MTQSNQKQLEDQKTTRRWLMGLRRLPFTVSSLTKRSLRLPQWFQSIKHIHRWKRTSVRSGWLQPNDPLSRQTVRWYYDCQCGAKKVYQLVHLQPVASERTMRLVDRLGEKKANLAWRAYDWVWGVIPTRLRLRKISQSKASHRGGTK